MRNRTIILFGLAAMLLSAGLSTLPAWAHGAIALGKPDDISTGGLAMGTGYNYPTAEGAKLRALEECLAFPEAPLETRGLCKIVESFERQCYAISLDPKEGTPGMGWSVAPKKADAEAEALARCRETAGGEREGFCVVSLSDCDAP
ncbi:MAG: DUF4189 domain-containing protein [Micropepsaceae bacterium]